MQKTSQVQIFECSALSTDIKLYINEEERRHGVCLIPGLFGGGWIWHDVASGLASHGYEVVALTEPLGLKPNVYDPQQVVGLLRDLIQIVFARPIVLAGNSFGGLVAMELAVRYPELVSALVLSGSPGLVQKTEKVTARAIVQPRTVSKDFGAEQAKKMFYNEAIITPELVDRVYHPFSRTSSRQKLAIIRALRLADTYDAAHLFPAISAPTLLLWGQQDSLTPGSAWERSVSRFHDARYVGIPQAGHSPMVEQPDLVTSAMTTFFEQSIKPDARVFPNGEKVK
jgi:2-hydroxy-6-oxonona-2,4-dienedioate hydrolase